MTPEEKETIIRWDSGEEVVSVYSCHRNVWTKADKAGWTMTESIKAVGGREIARSYEAPLNQFMFSLRRRENATKDMARRRRDGKKNFAGIPRRGAQE